MLMDALLNFSDRQSLTAIGAGATGYSDTIDLSQSRDLAAARVPIVVTFPTVPTSATGGATLNIAVQTSSDNATWTTLEETAPMPIANISSLDPYAFRGYLNAGGLRYLRIAYTPSAVLTAAVVTASLAPDWPRTRSYARNYVA